MRSDTVKEDLHNESFEENSTHSFNRGSLLAFTACSEGDKQLVMATNADSHPMNTMKMKDCGIDAEIAEAIAKKLDMELKIEDMEFGSIITAVQTGKVDMGMAGMTITEDRLISVNFSTPYTTASW